MAKRLAGLTVKKRNPQDLTLRNLHALKKRVARLEQDVKYLKDWLEGRL